LSPETVLAGVAALYLGPAAALFQVPGSLLLRIVADFDVVDYFLGAGRLGHPRGGALMLDHIRGSIPIGHAALHADGESVLAYFGFRQARPDFSLNLDILRSRGALGRRGRRGLGFGLRCCAR